MGVISGDNPATCGNVASGAGGAKGLAAPTMRTFGPRRTNLATPAPAIARDTGATSETTDAMRALRARPGAKSVPGKLRRSPTQRLRGPVAKLDADKRGISVDQLLAERAKLKVAEIESRCLRPTSGTGPQTARDTSPASRPTAMKDELARSRRRSTGRSTA